MSKKRKSETKRLLTKIRTSSLERYLAMLSLSVVKQKKPSSKEVEVMLKVRIKNLKNTIKMYTEMFNSSYDRLLEKGVSVEIIDDNIFYNWEYLKE
ncbi:MAG TPA: hypothetical protein VMX17_10390 [Candidatus Glassbacteria bacterium]|nr:hypothetical protein [Candidatus Glassbacteria bacterium]